MKKNDYSLYVLRKRLLATLIAVTFIFMLLFLRLFYIQIIKGENLQIKALDQWTRDLPVSAKRGIIYDRNGIVLATNETKYNIYLRAKEIDDPEFVAKYLSEILDIDYLIVLKNAKNKGVSEIAVKRNATKEELDKLYDLSLSGVYYSISNSRVYPYNDLLCQTLGYVSIDGTGQAGLENYYNLYLKGTDGYLLTETDLIGIKIDGSSTYYMPAIDGLDITLTIDYYIQSIVENVLKGALLAHNPERASAVVMNAKTGEILAMANLNGFNLNSPPRDDLEVLMNYSRNSIVVDIYEPGSTFKVLTSAANIQEYLNGNSNAFSPSHVFSNSSNIRVVDGQKIKCWQAHGTGTKHVQQTIREALQNSCNPIFVDMALALGKDTMYKYIESFGYGKATGIDFLGETTGMLLNSNLCKNCDLARIGFGQTIAVTQLQLINATAAAVNGGHLMRPYLLSSIKAKDGTLVKKNYSMEISTPISEETSSIMRELLYSVVEDGSGKNAKIEGVAVGGKTGTAQKYVDGKIANGLYISSFVGFFPADDPEYICLLTIDEPEGEHYGSTVSAPLVKQIFEGILALNKN